MLLHMKHLRVGDKGWGMRDTGQWIGLHVSNWTELRRGYVVISQKCEDSVISVGGPSLGRSDMGSTLFYVSISLSPFHKTFLLWKAWCCSSETNHMSNRKQQVAFKKRTQWTFGTTCKTLLKMAAFCNRSAWIHVLGLLWIPASG